MKRIFYRPKRGEADTLVSNKFNGMQGAVYEVEINTKDMTYRVRNVGQRKTVRSNELDKVKPPQHLNTLKAQAKKAIKRMGVKFDTEIRGLHTEVRDLEDVLSEIEELINDKENI